jgi:hypothetical protein
MNPSSPPFTDPPLPPRKLACQNARRHGRTKVLGRIQRDIVALVEIDFAFFDVLYELGGMPRDDEPCFVEIW